MNERTFETMNDLREIAKYAGMLRKWIDNDTVVVTERIHDKIERIAEELDRVTGEPLYVYE